MKMWTSIMAQIVQRGNPLNLSMPRSPWRTQNCPLSIVHCPLSGRWAVRVPFAQQWRMGNGQWTMPAPKLPLFARLLVMLWVTINVLAQSPTHLIRYEDSRVAMACTYSIVAYGEDEQKLKQAVNEAFDEVDRIDRLMSHYKPDSPLSQLNRAAAQRPVKTDPELFNFIAECLRYSRVSNGAFDITVGPLMKAWGFFRGAGRMPSHTEIRAVRKQIGWQHLSLNVAEQTIHFACDGVELDLGGIAKGYAVDRVSVLLKQHGIARALISAGGSTIYGLGSPPDSKVWEIQLQDPLDARKIAQTIRLKDQSLSVSGRAEKFFELNGKRYSHIMNPRTGRPVMNVLSVAVIAPTGTMGDALDNAFYVQGVNGARALLRQYANTQVIFFLPNGLHRWKSVHLK
jgi:thiamine biosynthesis lipoprotein